MEAKIFQTVLMAACTFMTYEQITKVFFVPRNKYFRTPEYFQQIPRNITKLHAYPTLLYVL